MDASMRSLGGVRRLVQVQEDPDGSRVAETMGKCSSMIVPNLCLIWRARQRLHQAHEQVQRLDQIDIIRPVRVAPPLNETRKQDQDRVSIQAISNPIHHHPRAQERRPMHPVHQVVVAVTLHVRLRLVALLLPTEKTMVAALAQSLDGTQRLRGQIMIIHRRPPGSKGKEVGPVRQLNSITLHGGLRAMQIKGYGWA